MSNPLDTLASEAVVHQNGDQQEQSQQPQKEDTIQEQDMSTAVNDNTLESGQETPLSIEEAAGGPPMPPAGQEAAALKEAIGAIPPTDDHLHIVHSPHTEATTLSLGSHGDAAMAAVDTRLDEDAPVPHTNGYLEQGLPLQSNGTDGEQQPNELDYERVVQVANSTAQDVQEGTSAQEEHIPPMSMDIDQPQGIEEPDVELPLPIAESVESAHVARLAVDSLSGEVPTSENLGEAILPAPGVDASQSLDTVEPEQAQPEQTTSSALENAIPSEQEQAQAGESSLASLPDEPTPLPSQLVNHTAPTTDATQSLPPLPTEQESSSSTTQQEQQQPQILENGSSLPPSSEEPARAPNAPPSSLSNLLDSSAPTPEAPAPSAFAPIPSPSIAKRPFEDDTSPSAQQASAEANYFGTAATSAEEPSSKRQRVSPEAMSEQATATATATAEATSGEAMQLDEQKPVISQEQQQEPQSAGIGAVDADGEADAEGDSDQANKTEQFGDSSMIDQSLDMSTADQSVSHALPPIPPSRESQPPSSTFSPQAQQQQQIAPAPQQGEEFKPPLASSSSSLPPPPPPQPANMPKEQVKYGLAILRQLKKKNEAAPFLQPVDPVALGIPHYPEIVKKPMDLFTVEKKLTDGVYKDVEEFSADMRQIWQNCYLFNGSDAPLSKWANTLSTLFEKQLLKMPTLASIQAAIIAKRAESPSHQLSQSQKGKAAAGAGGAAKARRPSTAQGGAPKPQVKKEQHSQQQMGYQQHPQAIAPGAEKPKKGKKNQQNQQNQMHDGGIYGHQQGMGMQMGPTPAQQQAHQQQLQQLLNSEQLKFCKEVMTELWKKQHSAFVYPFYEPVDWQALGLLDYPKVIKRPMDLRTMREKLDNRQYGNARAFENDFKLLIQNCTTYNPPMTPVHEMGLQLQSLFYEKWQGMPQEVPAHLVPQLPQQQQQQQWGGGGGGFYGGDGGNSYESEQIMLMQRQLELLTGNLEMLKSKAMMKSGGGFGGGMPSPMMSGMGMGMGMPMGGPPQHSPGVDHTPYGAPPPPPPKPRPTPAARPAPKAAPAPAPTKRRSSGSSFAAASTSLTTPTVPKPRTTKRSSMAGKDFEYSPPPRGFGRGGASDHDSDYEEEAEATVTFDMKKELADKIQEFDGPKLDKVVDIIRSNAPELLGDDNKEIELDIDMLDQRTLLKLYEYVVKPVGKGRQLKPKKKKVKGRNRGVDEVAEEERINALQAQLDAMQNNVAVAQAGGPAVMPNLNEIAQQANARPDVASSSSEDEDEEDGSDSESDAFDPGA